MNRIVKSNESLYERFGVSIKVRGMNCGVVLVVKCSILKWFGSSGENGKK